jgi:hypothetical protein
MINDELMQKFSGMMVDNEVFFLKGQIRNIEQHTKPTGEVFYIADLRVPRNTSDTDDIYSVSFNTYHVCFSNNFVTNSKITADVMKQYKDNEVVLNVSTQANIRSSKKDNAEMKFNNIKLFVNDMMLVKTIDKPDFSAKKVVNI